MSLPTAFRQQAISCAALGSPFMAQLLNMLADHWPQDTALAQSFHAYSGDIGPAGHSLPLRIAGGLHALVLSQRDDGLAPVYPPHSVPDDTLPDAVMSALHSHEDFLLEWTKSPPQTNEVRRAAVLMAGARVAGAQYDLPLHLSELGANGGLNLMWDHYGLEVAGVHYGPQEPVLTLMPDWTGPAPLRRAPQIASRAGVDLNPLDPQDAADLLRLTTYLWADHPERLALTRAAESVMTATIDKGDAIDWLAHRLESAPQGHLHLIQHSVAWQYFPAAVQTRGTALIEHAGAKATPRRTLAWLAMESDGDTSGGRGAAITLRLWPGNITLMLGRADFHGRWVAWEHGAANG